MPAWEDRFFNRCLSRRRKLKAADEPFNQRLCSRFFSDKILPPSLERPKQLDGFPQDIRSKFVPGDDLIAKARARPLGAARFEI